MVKLKMRMEHKNFGLSLESYEKLIMDLKKNDTRFFEQVFLKQFKETIRYLRRKYRTPHEEAYDATMDTLIEFRARFVEGKLKYGNLRFLFTKMASQMLIKNLKKSEVSIENMPLVSEEFSAESQKSEELDWLNNAWQFLGQPCQQLLTFHFYGKMKLSEIAEEKQKSPVAVRKQKERCVQKLKDVFRKNKHVRI